MTTSLTCFGAVGEIGGNKILLEDGERRVFFDFGKSFGRYGSFFDGVFIKERTSRGLLDPLALGLVPPLRGLLREDLLPILQSEQLAITEVPPTGRQKKARTLVEVRPQTIEAFWGYFRNRSPQAYRDLRREHGLPVDLILLSHAHQDHISDLEFVSPAIPACSSRMTAFISKVLLDTGQAGRSGAPFANPRVPDAQGRLQVDKEHGYLGRPWTFLEAEPEGEITEDPLDTAGSFWSTTPGKRLEPRPAAPPARFRLRHWPVDHSLLGAVGWAVETEAGWVGYTGDLRFHGRHGADTWRFADDLAALEPAALLCEGTRLTTPTSTTESEVFENSLKVVRVAGDTLVVADFAPRNVERLLSFLQIAAETKRRLLIQPKDAYLLRAMHLADPSTPDPMEHPEIGLYDDPKSREQPWEEKVRRRYRSRTVSPEEVARTAGDYLLAFSLTDVADLLDLEMLMGGRPGGIYIFSNSPAYDDEQKVDLVRLWNWTQHLGMQMIGLRPNAHAASGEVTEVVADPGYHASGHAGSDELIEFVRRVRPKTLIPIHTETPEGWGDPLAGTGIRIVLPEYATPIALP
ncbi:MAG: hypothetical protein MUP86_02265 [Dehalococcoidia bacterium]|nr:hypothetical protein [Dehalococcoidia bacterium]